MRKPLVVSSGTEYVKRKQNGLSGNNTYHSAVIDILDLFKIPVENLGAGLITWMIQKTQVPESLDQVKP